MKEYLPVAAQKNIFTFQLKAYRTSGSKARDSQLAGKQVER